MDYPKRKGKGSQAGLRAGKGWLIIIKLYASIQKIKLMHSVISRLSALRDEQQLFYLIMLNII